MTANTVKLQWLEHGIFRTLHGSRFRENLFIIQRARPRKSRTLQIGRVQSFVISGRGEPLPRYAEFDDTYEEGLWRVNRHFLPFAPPRGLVVKAPILWAGGRAFDLRPRQTKIFKLVVVAFPHALRIMGRGPRLARQCQDNGLAKYWLKTK